MFSDVRLVLRYKIIILFYAFCLEWWCTKRRRCLYVSFKHEGWHCMCVHVRVVTDNCDIKIRKIYFDMLVILKIKKFLDFLLNYNSFSRRSVNLSLLIRDYAPLTRDTCAFMWQLTCRSSDFVRECVCVCVWPAGLCWYSIPPPVTLQLLWECSRSECLCTGGTWRAPHLHEIHKRELFLASAECPLSYTSYW